MAECIICRDDEDTIKNSDEIVIKCNECDTISCKKCIEEYLLQTSRMYPHCPNCNKYIEIPNTKKEVLKNLISNMIEYDLANNLHETSEKEKLKTKLKECNDELNELNKKKKEIKIKKKEIEDLLSKSNFNSNRLSPCCHENCPGSLKVNNFKIRECDICEKFSCNKCRTSLNDTNKDSHECNPDDIKSIEEAKNSGAKPCPRCNTMIMRTQGCNQMYCTNCTTGFSWITREIIDLNNPNTTFHNPHYTDDIRNGNINGPTTNNNRALPIYVLSNKLKKLFVPNVNNDLTKKYNIGYIIKIILELLGFQNHFIVELNNINKSYFLDNKNLNEDEQTKFLESARIKLINKIKFNNNNNNFNSNEIESAKKECVSYVLKKLNDRNKMFIKKKIINDLINNLDKYIRRIYNILINSTISEFDKMNNVINICKKLLKYCSEYNKISEENSKSNRIKNLYTFIIYEKNTVQIFRDNRIQVKDINIELNRLLLTKENKIRPMEENEKLLNFDDPTIIYNN